MAMQRPLHVLINPPGAVRLYSSPPFWLYVIVAGVPSLLLTVLVCCSGYLGVRAFRQGHAARGAILLVVALVPFLLFTARMVEAALADREHARYIAGVAKIGPVIDYPKVFVVAGSLTEMEAARLMLAARFQEVDAFEYGPKGATYTRLQRRMSSEVRGLVSQGSWPRRLLFKCQSVRQRNQMGERQSAKETVRRRPSARRSGDIET